MPGDSEFEARRLAPPYVAFPTFKTMIASFKEHVIPSRVDRSVLGNFSGIVGSQLLATLRFLDLIDEERRPRPKLEELVAACGTDSWSPTLSKILQSAYAPVFSLNLRSATPSQFIERFRSAYPVEGSTLRKCLTFLVGAIVEARIPISPYITKNKKPRSSPVRKRQPRVVIGPQRAAGAGTEKHPPASATERPPSARKVSDVLFDSFDPKEMDEAQQAAVWTLLRYFKGRDQ
jgi:hypothetical protein